jgi:hypothetical protein
MSQMVGQMIFKLLADCEYIGFIIWYWKYKENSIWFLIEIIIIII